MGNCQAAEAATAVIQHPGNKVERIYWSVSAHEIMASNPGHYVALVITSTTAKSEKNGPPLTQLKLLRPDDTLLIGQVYRLISFEDVLKEFAAKKCVKLGKLLRESGGLSREKKKEMVSPTPANGTSVEIEHDLNRLGSSSGSSSSNVNRGVGRHHHHGGGQWKPALQSIAEVGN
ncbi:unnamed protein product [Ilex paraguariensis]|uniref:DUF4228 domain-containing protein n=1 Tax=Ilex paraguariensis TaxID=185542 RepID=A0ABC8RDN2_9AQUA